MCGIVGVVGRDAGAPVLRQMLEPIEHRGETRFRSETRIVEGSHALGMHRLAIVDEAHGAQPKVSKDNSVLCIFNGEVYNHSELRTELSKYFSFDSSCDTEVILYSYMLWGEDFARRLDGVFAIAIFDLRSSELLLARDPLGVKPLYISQNKDSVYFASEIKSLTAVRELTGIVPLPPGTVWRRGAIGYHFNIPSFRTAHQQDVSDSAAVWSMLKRAVEKRIPPEASSVACLLSGGIDSSAITWLAHQVVPEVVAYTLAIDQERSEDLSAARELCRTLGIRHVVVSPSLADLQEFYLQKGVYITESFEWMLVRNAVSYHFVCRAVAQDGFKYFLNGEGADELFGGYDFVYETPENRREETLDHCLQSLHRTYLQMADRASMFATVEARLPYMDKALVEICAKLPARCRIDDDSPYKNKVVLRELFENTLPSRIVNRPKEGMNSGAGYGRNIASESIYYQAVERFYRDNPTALSEDLEKTRDFRRCYDLDLDNIEEIYNFARYHDHGFTRLQQTPGRVHLNTPYNPRLIFG